MQNTLHDLTTRLKKEALVNIGIHVHHNQSGQRITVSQVGSL